MKQLIVFPGWVIIRCTNRFLPNTHPWKDRKFSLKDWAEHSTELNNEYSITFWICGICVIIALISLL